MQEVKMINPFTGEVVVQTTNMTETVHGVDSSGKYIGLVTKGTEYLNVLSAPINTKFVWDFENNNWKYSESLDEIKLNALNDIDALAGTTRLRYITDVPGQQAVYLTKLQQAQNYIQDNSISAPYIIIEAEVLGTSMLEAAQQIITRADLWNNIIGPQIEGIRRKNKLAVESATTAEEVYNIKALNVAELNAL